MFRVVHRCESGRDAALTGKRDAYPTDFFDVEFGAIGGITGGFEWNVVELVELRAESGERNSNWLWHCMGGSRVLIGVVIN